jgi:hypothetical protein
MTVINNKELGAIDTLHLIIYGRDESNIIELWLARDFRYLPIKVRYINPLGESLELLASSVIFR